MALRTVTRGCQAARLGVLVLRDFANKPIALRDSRMKKLRSLFALLFVLTLGVQEASAQFSLGVRGGYNLDAFTEDGLEEGAFALGGEARFGLGTLPVILNPGAEYTFTGVDDMTVLQFDANVLYPFGFDNSTFTPYVGAGLGVTRVSSNADLGLIEIEDSETDYGLNIIGGASFGFGSIQPFAQARITLGEHLAYLNEDGEGGTGYAVQAGLLFNLGR